MFLSGPAFIKSCNWDRRIWGINRSKTRKKLCWWRDVPPNWSCSSLCTPFICEEAHNGTGKWFCIKKKTSLRLLWLLVEFLKRVWCAFQVVRAFDNMVASDLTNGMKVGESQIFNSVEQSEEIRLFRKMAFGSQNYSTDFFSQNSRSSGHNRQNSQGDWCKGSSNQDEWICWFEWNGNWSWLGGVAAFSYNSFHCKLVFFW